MPDPGELGILPVDGPIGSIVDRIVREDPDLAALVEAPHRLRAFETLAAIRAGILLGELLFAHDVVEYDDSETWVEALLRVPEHRDALEREVRAVATEIAASAESASDEPLGRDEDARDRFRAVPREQLGRRA